MNSDSWTHAATAARCAALVSATNRPSWVWPNGIGSTANWSARQAATHRPRTDVVIVPVTPAVAHQRP
ncbi:MAG: hypothetical protein DLM59_17065 [Pseudonocardiales bacterium]|nr:MAG: hypothetical protein DLM59_17065 [Pseudonocardiales bacterium]